MFCLKNRQFIFKIHIPYVIGNSSTSYSEEEKMLAFTIFDENVTNVTLSIYAASAPSILICISRLI